MTWTYTSRRQSSRPALVYRDQNSKLAVVLISCGLAVTLLTALISDGPRTIARQSLVELDSPSRFVTAVQDSLRLQALGALCSDGIVPTAAKTCAAPASSASAAARSS